jgi:uncharacterized protein (DUF1015 family)
MGEMTDEDGVVHRVERVTDASRIDAIRSAIACAPVVIADGHHRYAISRTYRDEMRATNSPLAPAAGLTMTYVAELVEEQLSIAAIHRLVAAVSPSQMEDILSEFYTRVSDSTLSENTLTLMNSEKAICLVRPDGSTTLFTEKTEKFSEVRALDSARLEHAITTALGSLDAAGISYQHGTHEVLDALKAGNAQCAVLIRPVSLAEIRRTADEGLLMPPKSTFFTPKLRTGLAMRPLAAG